MVEFHGPDRFDDPQPVHIPSFVIDLSFAVSSASFSRYWPRNWLGNCVFHSSSPFPFETFPSSFPSHHDPPPLPCGYDDSDCRRFLVTLPSLPVPAIVLLPAIVQKEISKLHVPCRFSIAPTSNS